MPTDLDIAIGRITSSELAGDANAILGNLVTLEAIEGDPDAPTSEGEPIFCSLGMYGRPYAPVTKADSSGAKPQGTAEFIGFRVGDRVHPFGYRDLRLNAKIACKEGQGGMVQYQGGLVDMADNADGDGTNVTLYAVRNDANGDPDGAHVIALDTTAANSSVAIVHEYGHSVTLNKTGSIVLMNKGGDAMIEVNDSGVTINGANVAITGGAMLGDSNPASGDFVVLATQLLAWIVQVNAAIAAMAPGFNAAPVGTPLLSLGAGSVVPPLAVPLASSKVKAAL